MAIFNSYVSYYQRVQHLNSGGGSLFLQPQSLASRIPGGSMHRCWRWNSVLISHSKSDNPMWHHSMVLIYFSGFMRNSPHPLLFRLNRRGLYIEGKKKNGGRDQCFKCVSGVSGSSLFFVTFHPPKRGMMKFPASSRCGEIYLMPTPSTGDGRISSQNAV